MGHIQDRWWAEIPDPDLPGKNQRVKTDLHGRGLRYRVRYFDPAGTERSKSFPDRQKRLAEQFLISVENDKKQGTYLEPDAGKILFRDYAEEWLAGQSFKSTTRVNVPSRLRSQVYPFLGDLPLHAINPSKIRQWIRWMTDRRTAPSYRSVCFIHVSSILSAAVDDKRIRTNPCKAASITKPQPQPPKVVPWTDARVKAVLLALPHRAQITVPLGAACGLRQGEMFGLSPQDIDRRNNVLHVVRQIQQVNGKLIFCRPKREKSRTVPLSAGTLRRLDAHLEAFPAQQVTLPWNDVTGEPVTADLLMTDDCGQAYWRQAFNRDLWKPALQRAGMTTPERKDGTHALRHYYASVLLDSGESVKALSEYLGHADPGFTLRTYTHLLPSSHERARRALDARLGDADGLETASPSEDEHNPSSEARDARTGSRGTG
ncbi:MULTISPECIES: tyrosine-type recombinase/integrase [Actinoalloteichus]|uniref:Site-specific recombinase XerD n=1 Tax=Actinoalloteichus fjordicus TaxID=1612552 RepID=A0AAC9L8S1_9PSEU|nr:MULTISPECIES: site-specific integrase [Actinoalloteichus]APU12429.1 site-specific recombinase XerD [Actinoalloteichus fjordicus]APU18382.1 site-specific recombinase XerD [Actinoalloteichus sp. GBA129-24]